MNTLSLKTYIVALATIICPFYVLSSPPNSGNGGNINQLTLTGSVDGKSYFTEENTTVTWMEAKLFCKKSGLRLASISSVAQSAFLKNACNNVTFTYYHWTGGRDAHSALRFAWDHNEESLNSTVVSPISISPQQTLCVSILPDAGLFAARSCENKYKILCELN